MENKTKKPVTLIIVIVVVAILGITAVGYGSYYLVKTFGSQAVSALHLQSQNGQNLPTNGGETQSETQAPPVPTPTEQPIVESTLPPDSTHISHGLFAAFWEARQLLDQNFVDQPVDDNVLAQGAVDGIEQLLEDNDLSLASVEATPSDAQINTLAEEAGTPGEAYDAFLPLWEAWAKLGTLDVPSNLTETQFMRAALQGMMLSLGDPYTGYMDPDLSRQWSTDLSGEYEGIGAWVDTSAEFLTIIAPIPGSPAEAAGLQPGDRVVAIDGKDMTGIDGNIVIQSVLGPAGTTVVLTIQRDGVAEPFDVSITRAHITIPNVTYKMLDNGIAYLQLITFSENAYNDLHNALQDLLAQNPKGLILDLRGDGGGYLHIAINITSEFLDHGVVVYEEYGDGSRDTHEVRTNPPGLATQIPLVVLVDGGSASASEILAGAIQDYGRGKLVGTTTYGKGSVQLPIDLKYDDGSVRITIAKWLTPNGNHIAGVGLTPDVQVEMTQADVDAGRDPQLDAAVQTLLDEIQQ